MATIISTIGTVVTAAIGWVGQYLTLIQSTPILMFFVCIPVVGLGIGLVKRLLRV